MILHDHLLPRISNSFVATANETKPRDIMEKRMQRRLRAVRIWPMLCAVQGLLLATVAQSRSLRPILESARCQSQGKAGCVTENSHKLPNSLVRQADTPVPPVGSVLSPLEEEEERENEGRDYIGGTSEAIADTTERFSFETHAEVNATSILAIHISGFPKDKPVCRIEGICRSGDGSYLLPTWMKQYSGHIEKCGLRGKRHYVLEATKKEAVELDLSGGKLHSKQMVWTIRNISRSAMTLSERFSDYDLVGGKAPRELIHWLITDMTPPLFMLDLAARFGTYRKTARISSYACANEGVDTASSCMEGDVLPAVNPMILVDGRVSAYKSHHWPQGLMRLIRNSFRGGLKVADATEVYGWKMRSEASCFRSLIVTKASVQNMPSTSFDSSHVMWKNNGLTRDSVRVEKSPMNANGAPCIVKTLLLNKYGKRFMVGHDKLRVAIAKIAEKEIEPKHRNIRLLAETVFFENSSFHEQVSVMQESNIVVAAHGSSSANIAFLRPNSLVVEIVPFGLKVQTYKNLARTYGVNYKTITAQPDGEVFRSCLKHFNPSMPPGVLRRVLEWEENAKSFRAATIAHRANPTTDYRIPETPDQGTEDHIRLCTTYQRLSFNVEHVAKIVAHEALEQCGVMTPR